MFTQEDLKQIKEKGIEIKTIEKQLENFKEGFPFINLVEPATVINGIISFSENEVEELCSFFDDQLDKQDIIKFIPASGAATRMFKHLFEFREKYNKTRKGDKKLLEDNSFNSVYNFFKSIKKFAFYDELKECMEKDGLDIDYCIDKKDYNTILYYLLTDKGLDYSNTPKGLIRFHNYQEGPRMAVEEHLVESTKYCRDKNNKVAIRFTVSPELMENFRHAVDRVKPKYEKEHNVEFDISFTVQKTSTDIIAVDMNNRPFRNDDGSLLFRPGGHGALLDNLNDIDNEIIFIKNIDNIVPDYLRDETYRYKKVTGGYLIRIRDKAFDYLRKLEKPDISTNILDDSADFATNILNIDLPGNYTKFDNTKKQKFLYDKLNRPIRVCGMVKNEGEPGGGPFWIKNQKGEISLQIVEKSQIDLNDTGQKSILRLATHFNPVDIVCSIKNHKGDSFDLQKFVDPSTGFISIKSKGGRNLKAQELPGLWNGAMAEWNTVFVETPIITFNPVKTINDLLRSNHQ